MHITHIDRHRPACPCVVCVGNFDGVHLGHRRLLAKTAARAAPGRLATVYTFSRHPTTQLTGAPPARLLTTNAERLGIFSGFGIEQVVMDPFRPALAGMEPADFFRGILLDRLRAAEIVCGTEYRFGARGAGDAALMARLCAQHGVVLHTISPVTDGGRMISSTWIRELVLQGDVQAAARLMGRPYALLAEVCHGAQLGRRLGFPTVNQRFPALKLIPHPGVYATRLEIDGTSYIGATSVGTRPTVNGEDLRAETHILGYEGDLYGRFLKLEFLRYLREELRFASLDDLSAQLRLDARRAAEAAAGQFLLGRDA